MPISKTFSNVPQAKYFPVSDQPLTMKAGLHEFGKDFGNGPIDQNYFQRDCNSKKYKEVKLDCSRERHWATGSCKEHFQLHAKVLKFIYEKLKAEHKIIPPSSILSICNRIDKGASVDDEEMNKAYNLIALELQEDLAMSGTQGRTMVSTVLRIEMPIGQ